MKVFSFLKEKIFRNPKKWVYFIFGGIFWGLFLFWINLRQVKAEELMVANNSGQILFYNLEGKLLLKNFNLPVDLGHYPFRLEVGDVDGDLQNEIVVVVKKSELLVAILNFDGQLKYPLFEVDNFKERNNQNSEIFSPNSKKILSSFDFELGDINDDGKEEIVINTPPYLKIFNYQGKLLDKFIPFSKNFRGEIKFALGDVNRDREKEIIFSSTNQPWQVFFYKNKKIFPLKIFTIKNKVFLPNFDLASGDLDGDGKEELGVCSFSRDGNCQIFLFHQQGIFWSNNLIADNKIYLKFSDLDGDGRDEIICAEAVGGRINIYKLNGKNFSLWKTIYTQQDIRTITIFSSSRKIEAKVIYVDDGDTIFLDSGQEIRYIGVDTPEIGEPNYLEATNKNKELIYGKKVTIEYDQQKIDPYGRYLAYVFVDGVMINEKLVEEGLARTEFFYPNVKYASYLKKAEIKAERKKR